MSCAYLTACSRICQRAPDHRRRRSEPAAELIRRWRLGAGSITRSRRRATHPRANGNGLSHRPSERPTPPRQPPHRRRRRHHPPGQTRPPRTPPTPALTPDLPKPSFTDTTPMHHRCEYVYRFRGGGYSVGRGRPQTMNVRRDWSRSRSRGLNGPVGVVSVARDTSKPTRGRTCPGERSTRRHPPRSVPRVTGAARRTPAPNAQRSVDSRRFFVDSSSIPAVGERECAATHHSRRRNPERAVRLRSPTAARRSS
jgi:hypothetical protein